MKGRAKMAVHTPVERACFVKTDQERDKLSRLKKTWTSRVKSGYKCRTLLLAG